MFDVRVVLLDLSTQGRTNSLGKGEDTLVTEGRFMIESFPGKTTQLLKVLPGFAGSMFFIKKPLGDFVEQKQRLNMSILISCPFLPYPFVAAIGAIS